MTHQCPRPECSRSVSDDMFACRGDWYALPARFREAISLAWRSGKADEWLAARAEAIEWYADHPPRWATQPGAVPRRGANR